MCLGFIKNYQEILLAISKMKIDILLELQITMNLTYINENYFSIINLKKYPQKKYNKLEINV